MTHIRLLCCGKLKERFWADAAREYAKRLSAFCKLNITELPDAPGAIRPEMIPKGSFVVALCVEGALWDSVRLARQLEACQVEGVSSLCFLIGGSDGLSESEKELAKLRLSLSPMTWPHHMARVMLLEQIYRGYMILSGGKYHK